MTSKLSVEDLTSQPALVISLTENSHSKIKSSQKRKTPNCFINHILIRRKEIFSRKSALLFVLYVSFILRSAVKSLYAPFFPEVAKTKGASAMEYGLVFGFFELTALLVTPYLGAMIKIFGVGRMYAGGILIASLFSTLFGILPSIEVSKNAFIGCCLAVRCLESIGESAFLTASYTIIVTEFPDTVATKFARTEAVSCFGKMIGPTLGGFFYEVGGFTLPFLLTGGLLFLFTLVTCKVFTTEESYGNSCEQSLNDFDVVTKTPRILDLIKIPVVAMTLYSILVTAASGGFITTLLEPHLVQFKLSKTEVGFVFFLSAMAHGFTVPFLGNLCDGMKNPKLLTLFGSITILLGIGLIGPLPFLPFDTILWVVCMGLMLLSLGIGAVYVSTFRILLTDAIDKSYPEDVSVRGLVSGLWKTTTLLGSFIGNTVGGILDDQVGFRRGSLFVIGAEIILIVLLIIFLVKARHIAK